MISEEVARCKGVACFWRAMMKRTKYIRNDGEGEYVKVNVQIGDRKESGETRGRGGI